MMERRVSSLEASAGLALAESRGIDTVLFDVTGTLLSIPEGVGAFYSRVAAEHGLRLDPRRAEDAFGERLRAAPSLAFPDVDAAERREAERRWWWRVVEETLAAATDAVGVPAAFEAFFDDLYRRFAGADAWRVEPDAPPVLAALQERGLKLGVLSNFDSRLPALLAALGLRRHFSVVAASSALGAAKPDPGAFERALNLMGSNARSTAYIGDSPEVDARGAAEAGLLPVLLRAPLPDGVPGLRIERLTELLQWLPGTAPARVHSTHQPSQVQRFHS